MVLYGWKDHSCRYLASHVTVCNIVSKLYVSAALHSLVRKPAYTLISLLGLAVAFASLLLIGAYVTSEFTHDTWIPQHEDVYRLGKTATLPGQQVLSSNGSGAVEALWLKQDIPQISSIARLWPRVHELRSGEVRLARTVVWADPEVFQVLPFPVLTGNLDSALETPDTVVISRVFARTLLGTEQVVGRRIEVDGRPMRIAAVLDDLPGASHLSIDILASSRSALSPFAAQGRQRINFGPPYTYFRIAPGSIEAIRAALPALIDRHVSPADVPGIESGGRMSHIFTYELQPVSSIHLMSQKDRLVGETTDLFAPEGDRNLAIVLAALALLILLVATANFVNIMTARAAGRTVEIGVRKITGATRLQLVIQFIGESTVLATVGALAGITAGLLLLGDFGKFLNRDLVASFATDPLLVACLLAALLFAGAAGGIYPGLVMSSFRPAQVLKGLATHATRAGSLRKLLVVFQFTLLIMLVVAVIVIGRQIAFVLHGNFRVNTDQLLFIHAPCTDAFRDRVAAVSGTLGVACADRSLLGMEGAAVVPATLPDGTAFRFNVIGVGPGALELYGLKPLAGRFQSEQAAVLPEDVTPGVVINHAAVRGLRLASPQDAIGMPLPGSLGTPPQIIGVVDDFPLRSLRDAVGPMVFKPARRPSMVVVKLRAADVQQTLHGLEAVWKSAGNTGPFKSQFHDQFVRAQYEDIGRMQQLCTVFSVVAAFIAALGLYGLSALAIEQSAASIGVRKAYGASRSDILRLMLWQFISPVLGASLLAWPLSWLLMRSWLEGFAYHIDMEPWMFLVALALAMIVALTAVIGHALQLSRVRPVTALRYR